MADDLAIINSLQSQELFSLFKQQLMKDFNECGCNSEFIENLPPDLSTIQQAIAEELKRNEKRSGFNLQHLLYRVDINESRLKKELKMKQDSDYHMVLGELIIKRSIQKIVIKKYYSNNDHQNRIED